MKSNLINDQLKKCRIANLSNFNEQTGVYTIPKYSKPRYEPGKCYLIKVASDIINNKNSGLAVNWNNGRAPTHEYYKIYIHKNLGIYYYCDALAFDYETKQDLQDMFSGWFSAEDISLICTL